MAIFHCYVSSPEGIHRCVCAPLLKIAVIPVPCPAFHRKGLTDMTLEECYDWGSYRTKGYIVNNCHLSRYCILLINVDFFHCITSISAVYRHDFQSYSHISTGQLPARAKDGGGLSSAETCAHLQRHRCPDERVGQRSIVSLTWVTGMRLNTG